MSDDFQVLSEYGVIGQVETNKQFSIKPFHWKETFQTYADFSLKYGISPICKIYKKQYPDKQSILFLRKNEQGSISVTFHEEQAIDNTLRQCRKHSDLSGSTFRVSFNLGASQYHLRCMVKAYVRIAEEESIYPFLKLSLDVEDKESFTLKKFVPKWIANVPVSKIGAYTTSGDSAETIFYEMMAFLTAVRSLLDSLVRILKIVPSIRNGIGDKRSFQVLMNRNRKDKNYPLPSCFKKLIDKNYDWLSDAIEYRDCLLHYQILSPSVLPYFMVIHSENKLIAVQTWLHDNPGQDARSISGYSFDKHYEYLSYAHATYLRMLNFVSKFSNYVLNELQESALPEDCDKTKKQREKMADTDFTH
jgi:hypothetical protein